MVLLRALTTAILAFAGLVNTQSSTGDSVLVVLDKDLKKESFSAFFGGLEQRGYELTFREPNATKPLLVAYDVPQFNHVIFFSPSAKSYAADLSSQTLLTLLQQNVNLMIALGPAQTPMRSFAPEFGLILPPPNTPLISHFPKRTGARTIVPISVPPSTSTSASSAFPILSPETAGKEILFSGIPLAFTATSTNPQLVPILYAPAQSFATDTTADGEADVLVEAAERGGEGLWAGAGLAVLAGFQTRSGARVVWAGGVDMFGDEFAGVGVGGAKKKKTKPASVGASENGNTLLALDVAAWAFQERGMLRIEGVSHHRVGETQARQTYTTNDVVVYSLNVTRFDPPSRRWVPHSSIEDMQLDFTMLDPHIRTGLVSVPGSPGTYSAQFRVPDRHGVFKFVVDYRRKGWAHLYSATTVPIVPPRHDEYPRFLSAAWPYYTGAISSSVGFVLFCAMWLGGAGEEKKKKGKSE